MADTIGGILYLLSFYILKVEIKSYVSLRNITSSSMEAESIVGAQVKTVDFFFIDDAGMTQLLNKQCSQAIGYIWRIKPSSYLSFCICALKNKYKINNHYKTLKSRFYINI